MNSFHTYQDIKLIEVPPVQALLGENLKPLENDLINAQSALTSQALRACARIYFM
ncbi:hypothetical protein [Helicobacter marmotae]|uniref:hypothetical protein n=1 Tax=Helicobacter marmotae TaxID=152490 RepID=UPI001315AD29|nr:hypothetical protein [Helicobacter marmotae]